MLTIEQKELARWAMDFALLQGCQEVRVMLYEGSDTEFEVRNEQLDRLQQSTEHQMAFHLFVDKRYGAFSTNRLLKDELAAFIREGVEAVRFLAPDPDRLLPSPDLYYKGDGESLRLYDNAIEQLEPDIKLAVVRAAAAEVFNTDDRVLSVQSNWNDGCSKHYLLTSNGFEGEHAVSYYSLSVTVSVKGEGEAKPEAFWYDQALSFDDLIQRGIGQEALRKALAKVGQQKVASGQYTLLVDNLNSARLLSPLLTAISGASLQQNNSFLLNCLGKQVLSEKVTVVDDPHLPAAFGSRWFDNEGIATHRRYVFNRGVLETYFIDTYFASRMGLQQTISGPSRLVLELGNRACEEMIESIEKGILVTGFNGGNCNSSSGDFSFGIEGFFIEGGRLTQPIAEMNMTGNMLTLWSSVEEIGNDPRRNNAYQIPSLKFGRVDLSGH